MKESPISGRITPLFCRHAAWRVAACTTSESWIAYQLLREQYPDSKVVLVNFKPDGDNGSYKWQKHDWNYEAEYYHKHEVPIRILF